MKNKIKKLNKDNEWLEALESGKALEEKPTHKEKPKIVSIKQRRVIKCQM